MSRALAAPKIDRALLKAVNQELLSGSDRSAVLIAASVVDELLRRLIASSLKNSSEKLFDYPGALSSFSARIELARAMDLITKSDHENCERLRKIRNEFAHEINVGFTISQLSNKVLKKQLGALGTPGRGNVESEQRFYKSSFAILAMVLIEQLFRKVQWHSAQGVRMLDRKQKSHD